MNVIHSQASDVAESIRLAATTVNPTTLATHLLGAFSDSPASPHPDHVRALIPLLGIGFERDLDPLIVREISMRVATAKSPLNILEVGAGSSLNYIDEPHSGSPWLARKIAYALGERVNVAVSNLRGFQTKMTRYEDGRIKLSKSDSGERFSELETVNGRLYIPQPGEVGSDRVEEPFPHHYYVRQLSLAVESIFGIKQITTGVDVRNLEEHFMPGEFDVVFLRHMPRGFKADTKQFELATQSIQRILAPGGKGIITTHVYGIDQEDATFIDPAL